MAINVSIIAPNPIHAIDFEKVTSGEFVSVCIIMFALQKIIVKSAIVENTILFET